MQTPSSASNNQKIFTNQLFFVSRKLVRIFIIIAKL